LRRVATAHRIAAGDDDFEHSVLGRQRDCGGHFRAQLGHRCEANAKSCAPKFESRKVCFDKARATCAHHDGLEQSIAVLQPAIFRWQ
jgi:hypothetical protein